MPKQNRTASGRSRRQCSKVDNPTTVAQQARKSATRSNRYRPFPSKPRKDTSNAKGNKMLATSMEELQSRSSSILESGIRYIMFPLHLLRFCIFGTAPTQTVDKRAGSTGGGCKQKGAEQRTGSGRQRKEESTAREGTASDDNRSSRKTRSADVASRSTIKDDKKETARVESSKVVRNDGEESNDEMMTAEEDSDSNTEHWSSANSTMVNNLSTNSHDVDGYASHEVLEEPMDISMEEHTPDRTLSMNSATRDIDSASNDARGSTSSRSRAVERERNCYVDDEEIARIFQKQCTSSEDEFPSSSLPTDLAPGNREKSRQIDLLHEDVCNNHATRSRRETRNDERERKKKTTSEFVGNSKRRKVTHEEVRNEKNLERRGEKHRGEGRHSGRQDTPSKQRSRSSRTPIKGKETKRRDVKYKETATQTDSAFSDDDVEMVPIDASHCRHGTRKFHHPQPFRIKEQQELHYVADNEDTNDGFLRIAHKRISSSSTSSSSTDLGFDERASATPDTDVPVGQWRANVIDSMAAFRAYTRAPPGFPEVPQNPPLTPYVYRSSSHVTLPTLNDNNDLDRTSVNTLAYVPPAPSPMRHLYYDYPEFMDIPAYVHSSRILNNVWKNNYHR